MGKVLEVFEDGIERRGDVFIQLSGKLVAIYHRAEVDGAPVVGEPGAEA